MGREDADRPQNHCYFTVCTGSNQTSCGGNPATSWTVCTEKWAQSSKDFLLLHPSLAIIHHCMATNGGQEGNQDKMVILGAGSGAPVSHAGVPGAESRLCCCSVQPGRQQMMSQVPEVPATHMGDLEGVPGSWLWSGLALPVVGIWRVK